MDDDEFLAHVVDRLARLPAVSAIALGGSRAQGVERPDSDWDFGVYYRGDFDTRALRDIGWAGEVFEVGGWGGGVFNGGAWLTVQGRRVDVHYRNLDEVEHEMAEAEEGRFRIEPLLFHLAGIPTYLVVAELALNRVLSGQLPGPEFPAELQRRAPQIWWTNAELTFDYAAANYAQQGRAAGCVGLLVQGALQAAHAILAARGEWITNEKRLLTQAGLDSIDDLLGALGRSPSQLTESVNRVRTLCAESLRQATGGQLPSRTP
jgi:hypothetical protein